MQNADAREAFTDAMRALEAIMEERGGDDGRSDVGGDSYIGPSTNKNTSQCLIDTCQLTLKACARLAERKVRNPKVFFGSHARECALIFIKLIQWDCSSQHRDNHLEQQTAITAEQSTKEVDVCAVILNTAREIRAAWLKQWSKSVDEAGKSGVSDCATRLCLAVVGAIICFHRGMKKDSDVELQNGDTLVGMMRDTLRELRQTDGWACMKRTGICTVGLIFLSVKSDFSEEKYGTNHDEESDSVTPDSNDDDDYEDNAFASSMTILGCSYFWYMNFLDTQGENQNESHTKDSQTTDLLQTILRPLTLQVLKRLLLDGVTGKLCLDISGKCRTGSTISPVGIFLQLLHSLLPAVDRLLVIKNLYFQVLREGSYHYYHNATAALLLANVPRTLADCKNENVKLEDAVGHANSMMNSAVVELIYESLAGLHGDGKDTDSIIHCNTDRIIGGLNVLRFLLLNQPSLDGSVDGDGSMPTRRIVEKFEPELKALRRAIDSNVAEVSKALRAHDDDIEDEFEQAGNKPLGIEIMTEVLSRIEEIIALSGHVTISQ